MKPKTRSFNILDVFILLLIAAIIAVGAYILFFRQGSTEKVKIDYTIEVDYMRNDYKGNIKVGDKVVSTVSRDVLGTVVNVEYVPCESLTTNLENGEVALTQYPGEELTKAIITVRSDAVYENDAYYVGAIGIYVGSTVYFRVPNFIGGSVCVTVKPVESGKM